MVNLLKFLENDREPVTWSIGEAAFRELIGAPEALSVKETRERDLSIRFIREKR